jgi:DNA modification methylase
MSVVLHEGDNRQILRRMIDAGERVHSCVTDPPYGLVSVTKRFGKAGAAPAKFGSDGAFARVGAGFMGQAWDGSGIERDPEFWRLIYDVLLPGGYCLAFSSPRTGHWQACAMEMAGFVIHPFFGWVYGQGFPKAHNVAAAIDKAAGMGAARQASGDPVRRLGVGAEQSATGDWEKLADRTYQPGGYVPATEEAEEWLGWYYGGQSTKPALEPIYVAQRPHDGPNGALSVVKHGVGAMNIDACRVSGAGVTAGGDRGEEQSRERGYADKGATDFAMLPGRRGGDPGGRWPANLLHDGSPDVVAMFPSTPGQLVRSSVGGTRKTQHVYSDMVRGAPGSEIEPRGDVGSAARFFNAFPFDADPVFYCQKATKTDRAGSKHPTVKPIALMRWLCRLVTPPGGMVLDPFAGSGTTGKAACDEGFHSILIEQHPVYAKDIRRRFAISDESILKDCDDILGPAVASIDDASDIDGLLGTPCQSVTCADGMVRACGHARCCLISPPINGTVRVYSDPGLKTIGSRPTPRHHGGV